MLPGTFRVLSWEGFADGEERHSRQREKPGQEVWKEFTGAGVRGGLDSDMAWMQ